MALYRETATGFVQEWATNPGAGYTAITSQPTDTIDHKVSWWRALDTFSQTSEWHPSLPGTPEYPGPDTRSGSGINIMPSDYASFEWAGSAPPTYTANATVARSTAYKYHGSYGLRYSISATGGIVGFASSASIYNITLNPNGKWIVSAYVRPVDNAVRTVSLQLTTTAGNTYTVTGNTLGNNASWVRITGVFDLSADASTTARMAISLSATGVQVDIDAVMLEEKVGPLSNPSTFNSPWGTGISTEQYPDYGIPQTKLYQDLGARIDLIDGAAGVAGTVNARIKTETDARTTADSAISSTVTTLTASVNTNSAAIQTEATARATADSALATTISTVQTTVDGHTASIQTQAQSINGLQASFFVKTDVNGYVAGFGIFNNGPGESGFLVRADKFAIGFPGNSNRIPFYVDSTGTYIYDAFIKNLTADKITGGTIGAQTINMSGATSIIKSSNYSAGVSGWQIKGDGTAEFQNVTVRGRLNAGDLGDGYLPIARLNDGSITDAKIGSLSANKISAGTIDARSITVDYLNASNIRSGTLDINRLSFTPVGTGNVVSTINASSEGLRIASGKIYIDGYVSFGAGYDPSTKIQPGGAATDINNNTTEIEGGKIKTGSIVSDKIDTKNLTIKDAYGNIILSSGVALSNTYIASVTADKIDTGTISAKTLTLNGGAIKSLGFSSGYTGWQIDGAGNAEFNTAIVRKPSNIGYAAYGASEKFESSQYTGGGTTYDEFMGTYYYKASVGQTTNILLAIDCQTSLSTYLIEVRDGANNVIWTAYNKNNTAIDSRSFAAVTSFYTAVNQSYVQLRVHMESGGGSMGMPRLNIFEIVS